MALTPVVSVGDGDVVLSFDVVAGLVIGWRVENKRSASVDVRLVAGSFSLINSYGTGVHTGTVLTALQWLLSSPAAHSLTVRWSR